MKLIFEKSVPAGRASCRDRAMCRRASISARDLLREQSAETAGAERAGRGPPLHGAVAPQLRRRYELLPAGLVHDEVQPEGVRADRHLSGLRALHPLLPQLRDGRHADAGRPGDPVRDGPAAARDHRHGGLHDAAAGRRARRADRHDDHGRLPPRQGQQKEHRPGSRQRPRHQPRQRRDCGLPRRVDPEHGIRRHGPRRPQAAR